MHTTIDRTNTNSCTLIVESEKEEMESKKKNFERNNSSQLDNECRNGGKDEKTDDDRMGKTENEEQTMDHQYESEREHNDDNDDDDVVLARKNELPTAINKLKSTEETIKDSTDDSDVKPSHSYIALIAMAILSCANKKMILGDIYQYISDNYPYYRNKDKSWRNSIRHNLSLNECFIKAGRSENGKGNYWAIHPANLEDFSNGDFRRRRARRRVRKSNALKFSNGLTGFSYYRSYTPLSAAAYSTFLPYKNDDYSRIYSPVSGYSSYGLTSGNRKNFAIDNIIAAPTNYKQYYPSSHPSLMYNQSTVVSPYPLSLSSESTLGTARCSPVPNITSCADGPFVGPYSSSLSALASLSSSQRGNESWQDTLCKLQENLKKPSHT